MEFHYLTHKMSNFGLAPSAYVHIQQGKVSLLLNGEYKKLLLQMGIEDPEAFLTKHGRTSPHLKGRILLFTVSLKNGKKLVVRRYTHGGWLRFFTRDLFFSGSRGFHELRLTDEIQSAGIPTVQPIAAIHARAFLLFYRDYFLSIEIPNAKHLPQFLLEIGSTPSPKNLLRKRETIRAAGLLLQRFHQKGFFHRDLQLKNILIVEDRPHLIDFDRSSREEILSLKKRIDNLLRLNRSVDKWKRQGIPLSRTDRWRFFRAYSADDPKMREVLRRALHTYSVRILFHQCFWKLSEVLTGRNLAG